MKVLVVDGPYRGKVIEVEGRRFEALCPRETDVASFWAEGPDIFEPIKTVTYQVGRVRAFGRMLWVAYTGFEPSEEDLFKALMSRNAKRVVIR